MTKCYDKFNQPLSEGDYVDVQKDGAHQIYKKEDGELYFKPYGKEDKVSAYFSNDMVKCDETGKWIVDIVIEEQTKCYCGHTNYCDCGPNEVPEEEPKEQTIEGILETLDTKQLDELDTFLKGVEWKDTQNKELYDDLVDLLERLRPIYREDSDLHLKYEQKRLELIETLKKK